MTTHNTKRTARVVLPKHKSAATLLDTVRQYLPANYTARLRPEEFGDALLIEGEDDHGWTLDGYVLPRLGSGLITAREIDA